MLFLVRWFCSQSSIFGSTSTAVVLRRGSKSIHLSSAFDLNSMECKALTTFLGYLVPSPSLISFAPPFAVAGGSYREQFVRVMKWRRWYYPPSIHIGKLANPRACLMSCCPLSRWWEVTLSMFEICEDGACGCVDHEASRVGCQSRNNCRRVRSVTTWCRHIYTPRVLHKNQIQWAWGGTGCVAFDRIEGSGREIERHANDSGFRRRCSMKKGSP